MEEHKTGKDPPWITEEWLVRPDTRIELAEVVEEAEVVVDLQNNGTYRAEERSHVYVAGPLADAGREEGAAIDDEGLDLHPGDEVVNEPGAVEESRGRREVPAVARECHEAEGAVGHGEELFEENEFMQQDFAPHVGDGDTGHDDQGADHEALRPGFEDEVFIGGVCAPVAVAGADRAGTIGAAGEVDDGERRHMVLL